MRFSGVGSLWILLSGAPRCPKVASVEPNMKILASRAAGLAAAAGLCSSLSSAAPMLMQNLPGEHREHMELDFQTSDCQIQTLWIPGTVRNCVSEGNWQGRCSEKLSLDHSRLPLDSLPGKQCYHSVCVHCLVKLQKPESQDSPRGLQGWDGLRWTAGRRLMQVIQWSMVFH